MTWIIESTCVGQVPPKVERGAVFLHVVDDFGGSVIPTDVRILNQAGANVSLKNFDGVLHGLPYGDYTLFVGSPGFLPLKGTLIVNQPRTRITVGLEVGPAEGSVLDRCHVSGELTGVSPGPERQLWVRLLPLFGNEIFEADVTAAGKFYSDEIRCGKYILTVIGEQGVIRTVLVNLTKMTKPLSIQIGKAGNPLNPR
jgi:hypothetical protein